jgi:metal-dependent hydrolase (beta-lactamase superfamily II)
LGRSVEEIICTDTFGVALKAAFGKTSTMKKDWGFAALIEYGGKRILFETGNNAEIFAQNVEARGIDWISQLFPIAMAAT